MPIIRTHKLQESIALPIPSEIQKLFNPNPDNKIEYPLFFIDEIDVEELFGILHKPDLKTVSVEEMNEAIAEYGGEIT